MGRRGPKPTPTAILKLRGSILYPRRGDKDEKPEMPNPPAILAGRALEVWHEVAPKLFGIGVLTQRDAMPLARYCELVSQWESSVEILRKYGPTIMKKDKDGRPTNVAMNPQVKDSRTLAALLMKLEAEFGMTPASRAGIGQVTDNKNDDTLQDLLKRG